MKLSSILQYSSIDRRFLDVNLAQLSKVSDEIIIPICDHLFNGESENKELLEETEQIAKKYSLCKLFYFAWKGDKKNPAYYHNLSRKLGTEEAKNKWLFFVDADEIVSDEFGDWLDEFDYSKNAYWLTSYWYFREPIYRAKKREAAGLLIKKELCKWDLEIRDERRRFRGIKGFVNGETDMILSKSGEPMVHHYSWVRTKDGMLLKVKNWGHKGDKNWTKLVEVEFSRDFDGTDFVHGYEYDTVKNLYNL